MYSLGRGEGGMCTHSGTPDIFTGEGGGGRGEGGGIYSLCCAKLHVTAIM